MGKVPAIVHKGKAVTECAAICAYLADSFPEADLAPAPADRADYYRWMFFTAGPVEQAITAKHFGVEPDVDQQRMAGFGSLAAALRSEEHTSELQSLMRISYAVFCLKTKTINTQ